MTAPPHLLPYGIPPEVLDCIVAHIPEKKVLPLLRVNSEWYAVVKPYTCRVHSLKSRTIAQLASKNHNIDIDRPSGRPVFRSAWLRHTHTLTIEPHNEAQCQAAVARLDLPALRTVRCAFRPHSHPFDGGECAFFRLPQVVILTDVQFEYEPYPLPPPMHLRLRTLVLQFSSNASPIPRDVEDLDEPFIIPCFSPWFDPKYQTAQAFVALLPQPTDESPTRMFEDLLVLCTMGYASRRTVMVVGGFMDKRATSVHIDNQVYLSITGPSYRDVSAADLMYPLLKKYRSAYINSFVDELGVAEEEREATTREVIADMGKVEFCSLHEVPQNCWLSHVLPNDLIKRAGFGQNPKL
ncbi:hypothetical protein CcaverHIS002_0608250 [Cutaneotrichosporon cavernicola]|nr:hypothetical protein CcaverHIS002_0608250 [Cutaneotrichosporon cavernicola]BEJ02088.1 hypothetical protein CcaverHIS631_0607700 [Cutaneotrichosporon cavernicola]BEJ09851.1 hypothetical protein CcaverHIS641_0607660 [Cutaneotrichosporon cavernicola]